MCVCDFSLNTAFSTGLKQTWGSTMGRLLVYMDIQTHRSICITYIRHNKRMLNLHFFDVEHLMDLGKEKVALWKWQRAKRAML